MARRWQWVAVLALLAGLMLAGPAQAAPGGRVGRVANTGGENLRLRAAPATDAAIIKRLGPGWHVTIIGEPSPDGHWLRVEHAGQIGYVAVGYIALVDPETTGEPRTGRVANTGGANLRVRAQAGLDAPIVKRLGPGWQVTILEGPVADATGATWLKVEHTGTTGWAAAAYIAEAEPSGP